MVALGGSFQGEENSFEPLPAGEYVMQITASSMEATSRGDGRYLKLEMEIADGPQAGRKLTERLNLENPNSKAVEIAQRTLRNIIFASGLGSCTDSSQLHMRKMLVRVNVKPRNDKPDLLTNEIGAYKPIGGNGGSGGSGGSAPAAASPKPAPQSGGAAGGSGGATSAPWKRNAA